jgi:hypothetical protein
MFLEKGEDDSFTDLMKQQINVAQTNVLPDTVKVTQYED